MRLGMGGNECGEWSNVVGGWAPMEATEWIPMKILSWNNNGWVPMGGNECGEWWGHTGCKFHWMQVGGWIGQLRSTLLADVAPRGDVQHTGTRRLARVRRRLHEDLSGGQSNGARPMKNK